MSSKKEKWNQPSWPWELELITLIFVVVALFTPFYFHHYMAPEGYTPPPSDTGGTAGQNPLGTTIGFLMAMGIVALYVFHIAFSAMEVNRVTASPHHLLAPAVFSVIAYYRIDSIPNLQDTALSLIDGTKMQVIVLALVVGLITSIIARLRTSRYLADFNEIQWDITSKAQYDSSYGSLLLQLRPLLYAPRRYRACSEGILVEGWFYAMPIGFNDVHALSIVHGTSSLNSGYYYASSSRHLVRVELHDSLKPTFISPSDREEFIRYCAQYVARRRPSRKASPTRHGMLHATDTNSATTQGGGASASSTRHPTS